MTDLYKFNSQTEGEVDFLQHAVLYSNKLTITDDCMALYYKIW